MGSDLQQQQDEYWMMQALRLAQSARDQGEVPVGAVLVKDNVQIAQSWNQSIGLNDPSAHAEILCLREAAKALNNYRLLDTTLYVTLEPCAMCAGALIHARIARLVYAAPEPKAGCVDSHLNVLEQPFLNHHVAVSSGVLEAEASNMLSDFFAARRREKKRAQRTHMPLRSGQLKQPQLSEDLHSSADDHPQSEPIASPCVSVCALNSDDICIGCYRSCNEITQWNQMTNAQKQYTLRLANQRCKEQWA